MLTKSYTNMINSGIFRINTSQHTRYKNSDFGKKTRPNILIDDAPQAYIQG